MSKRKTPFGRKAAICKPRRETTGEIESDNALVLDF